MTEFGGHRAGSRSRAYSAPPAPLHYAWMAHVRPLEPRPDIPHGRHSAKPKNGYQAPLSPNRISMVHEVIAASAYCQATNSLCNPRDPRPFGLWLFPSCTSAVQRSNDSRQGSPQEEEEVGNATLRSPLTPDAALTFLKLIEAKGVGNKGRPVPSPTMSNVASSSGVDARSAVAQIALATIKHASSAAGQGSTANSPSAVQASGSDEGRLSSDETTEFFKRKYMEAVESIESERSEFQRRYQAWEAERATLQVSQTELQRKLQLAEAQMSIQRENSQRAVESCIALEEENKTLRRELLESSEQAEKLKEIASRQKQQLNTQIMLNKDCQGQLDVYRGNTSVPLFADHPDSQMLRAEKASLEEGQMKLMTRLGEATKQFATEKKRLEAEVSELKARLAALTTAAS